MYLCSWPTLGVALVLAVAGAAGAVPVPVTVTITSVACTQDDECDAAGLEAAGESAPDFYAKIFINGAETITPRAPDDRLSYEPTGWTATAVVDDVANPKVPVNIQIWDHDSTSGDDLGDTSPQADHNNLDLLLDVASGSWSGDGSTSCVTGDGVDTDDTEYYPIKVCFDITVGLDSDNDGLTDQWETSGFDADGDGVIDLDLPAMGASPNRPDIFLELDYEANRPPTRNGIAALKRAFALAPFPGGINLHVDVGTLVDPTADEAGTTGTCIDGIDNDGNGLADGQDATCQRYVDVNGEGVPQDCGNGLDDDGDGLVDGADPNCRVGDDFGGGAAFPTPVLACGLNPPTFAAVKAAAGVFDPVRERVFHYAIQAAAPAGVAGCAGGEGEIGGDDFISHNRDAGTLMHELGHNLNLRHGGNEDRNCKPNYVSVMNYNLQGGIPRVGGGVRLDYSPPRQALDGTTRSAAPLGPLVENALNELAPIDPADPANLTFFMAATNRILSAPLAGTADYNGDLADPPFETVVTANIDNGIAGVPPAPNIGAPGCANGSNTDTLTGSNDWSQVNLKFRQFPKGGSGVVGAEADSAATEEELEDIDRAYHTTDLRVALAAAPDPVAAGTTLTLSATVTNGGPNPATAPALTVTLPPETTRTGPLPAGCTEPAPGTVACVFPWMPAGASQAVSLDAAVPADLVYNAGGPLPVSASAKVEDRTGFEENAADNEATTTVTVVAVADLSLSTLVVENRPVRMRVGEDVVVSLSSGIGSGGPSSPMDTLLTLTASPDAGASVSPTWLVTAQDAVLLGEARMVGDHVIISCQRPGVHDWAFAHRIDPARAPDSDPDLSNNETTARLTVECEGREPVKVNLQPGSWPNRVKLHTREATIAVLTTKAGEYGRAEPFDAATILVDSVRIGTRRMLDGSEPGTDRIGQAVLDDSIEPGPPEVVQDGDADLSLFVFDVDHSGLRVGDTEVCVKAMATMAGGATEEVSGCDRVEVFE